MFKKIFRWLIESIFPMINNSKGEKKLREKESKLNNIDSEDIYTYELEYLSFDENSGFEPVKGEYENSLLRVKQFEEKAKTNLIAISISVTITLGLIKPITDIYQKYQSVYISNIIFIISIFTVGFMLYGGVESLKVIMDKNIIYKAGIKELSESEESLKRIYGMYGELNEINNSIRNNYINTSYKCMKNALVLLISIFLLGILPINNSNEKEMIRDIELLKQQIIEININRVNDKEEMKEQEDLIKELQDKITNFQEKLNEIEEYKLNVD
ncbi:MAG: hypothetical protein ACRC30_09915 [Clostridium sp.]